MRGVGGGDGGGGWHPNTHNEYLLDNPVFRLVDILNQKQLQRNPFLRQTVQKSLKNTCERNLQFRKLFCIWTKSLKYICEGILPPTPPYPPLSKQSLLSSNPSLSRKKYFIPSLIAKLEDVNPPPPPPFYKEGGSNYAHPALQLFKHYLNGGKKHEMWILSYTKTYST